MIVVLMGVTGSGKTTVGKVLAKELGWKFYDADDYHPPENIEKMHRGIPLTDEDRKPWLQALAKLIRRCTGPWREHRSCLFRPQACLPGVSAASSGCASLRLPLWTTGGDSEEVGISHRSVHEPGTAAEPVRDSGAARRCDPGGCDWKSRRDRR